MLNIDARDYLLLIWKEKMSRRQYIVGQLSKNGKYEFCYGFEVEQAIKVGFKLLISFEELDKVYNSDILFPVFASRLPDSKRNGIRDILKKYGLDEYDEFKLLKRSGAKLPIDNLEFIDPIFDLGQEEIVRLFYVAGPRHYIGCSGDNCSLSVDLNIGDELKLEFEPNNKFDVDAIKILDKDGNHIGYLPRYYCKSVKSTFENGFSVKCYVYEYKKENKCNECIRAKLFIEKC